jgi:hypothetical protein
VAARALEYVSDISKCAVHIAASASDNSQGGCEIATSPLCLVSFPSSAHENRGWVSIQPEPAVGAFGWSDYPVLLDEPLQKRR